MQKEDARPFRTHTLSGIPSSRRAGSSTYCCPHPQLHPGLSDSVHLAGGGGVGGRSLPVYKFLTDAEAANPRTTL